MQNKSPGPSANYPRATLLSAHAPRPSTQGHNGANGQLNVKSWGGYPSRYVSVHARVCVSDIYTCTLVFCTYSLVWSYRTRYRDIQNVAPAPGWGGGAGSATKKSPRRGTGGGGPIKVRPTMSPTPDYTSWVPERHPSYSERFRNITDNDGSLAPSHKPLTPPTNVSGRGGGTPLYFSTGHVAGGVKGFEMTRSKMGFPTKPVARDSLTPSFVCKQQRGVVGAPGTLQIGETWGRISTATGIRPSRERRREGRLNMLDHSSI